MELAKKYLPYYTYKDYKQWEGDWELIEGIPYAMSPSPTGRHQRLISELIYQLRNNIEKCPHKCFIYPELDWIISEDTVVRPDIVIVCREIDEYLKETPEVVIEVVSPGSVQRDERLKFELYEREGVKIYILVYPYIKKVRAFKLVEGKYSKFFDSDRGNLEISVKDCALKVKVETLW